MFLMFLCVFLGVLAYFWVSGCFLLGVFCIYRVSCVSGVFGVFLELPCSYVSGSPTSEHYSYMSSHIISAG